MKSSKLIFFEALQVLQQPIYLAIKWQLRQNPFGQFCPVDMFVIPKLIIPKFHFLLLTSFLLWRAAARCREQISEQRALDQEQKRLKEIQGEEKKDALKEKWKDFDNWNHAQAVTRLANWNQKSTTLHLSFQIW